MNINFEEIQSRIKSHLQTQYFTKTEIFALADQFPDFVISGEFYRVYLVDDDYGSLLYWSKTESGCLAYLNHTHNNSQSYQMIRATVSGIDLNALIAFLNSKTPDKSPTINPYADEEEILALTVENIKRNR